MRLFFALSLCAFGAPLALAGVGFFDDFESYVDTTAMTAAGAWGDGQDAGQAPLGTLALTGGNPNQGMLHNVGETNRHIIDNVSATVATPIVWEFDFVDPGNSSNRRITGGLRVGTSATILEMGIHNNNDNPDNPPTNVAGYAIRTVSIGGPSADGGWICFPSNPAIRAGVHHFRATILPTSIDFTLDFGADGTIDATRSITTNDTSAVAWKVLRI